MKMWFDNGRLLVLLIAPVIFGVKIGNCSKTCGDFEECFGEIIRDNDISCNGELSCGNVLGSVDVSAISGSSYVNCNGNSACREGYFYFGDGNGNENGNTMVINSYGAFGLADSRIIIGDGVNFGGNYYGYYSGYNSVIACNQGSSCTINCYGFGCVGLTLDCDTSLTCVLNNDDSFNYSPNGSLVDDKYYRGLLVNTNDLSMNDAYSLLTPPYSDADCPNYSDEINPNPMCYDSEIRLWNSYLNLYCSGSNSCKYSSIDISSSAKNNGFYCTGDHSCQDTRMNGRTNDKNTSVYCGGFESCESSIITGCEDIYVLGYLGASNAEIKSGGNNINVYFGADYSGNNAKIICDNDNICNIYCDTKDSCKNTIMECNGFCVVHNHNGIVSGTWDATKNGQEINFDSEYNIYGVKSNSGIFWDEAQTYCKNVYGTDLASINSENKNIAVSNSINNNQGWIGLNDFENEGQFEFIDGTDVTYTNWGKNQPDDWQEGEDCGRIGNDGKWNDTKCPIVTFFYFVCNSQ